MKELYLNAEMELVEFSAVDIIATSSEHFTFPNTDTQTPDEESVGGW